MQIKTTHNRNYKKWNYDISQSKIALQKIFILRMEIIELLLIFMWVIE